MSGIRGLGGAPVRQAGQRAPPGATRGFRIASGGANAMAPTGALVVAAPAGLSLLALQENSAVAERDLRARSRGLALIAALAALQAGLLRGVIDAALPARLAALSEGEAASDPALAALLAEATLRARIELARMHLSPPLATDVAPR
ncbi:MAG: hypothetical protein JWO24_3082 [Rhodospirillales bacterium]|jgi:hypothetical protein|nr:hypothetical protein [Rhodospirillales bacterium]